MPPEFLHIPLPLLVPIAFVVFCILLWYICDVLSIRLIRRFIIMSKDDTMEPTLQDIAGYSILIGMKFRPKRIRRGDIVRVTYPNYLGDGKDFCAVRRVIALPGDEIQIGGRHVFVNGLMLEEPYIKKPFRDYDRFHRILGEDEYFVMGDNRGACVDSRHLGAIRGKNIGQKILLNITPHLAPTAKNRALARVGNRLRDAQTKREEAKITEKEIKP